MIQFHAPQNLGTTLRTAFSAVLGRMARAGRHLFDNREAIAFVALFVVSGLTMAPGRAAAQSTGIVVKLPNEQLAFKAPLAGLPQTAILYGDPTKAGLYVARVKFPAGVKVMPHTHTDEVRTVLIMSGTMYFGLGEQWDESKLKVYPAGTFFTEPSNTPHFAWAKDGEVIDPPVASTPRAAAWRDGADRVGIVEPALTHFRPVPGTLAHAPGDRMK